MDNQRRPRSDETVPDEHLDGRQRRAETEFGVNGMDWPVGCRSPSPSVTPSPQRRTASVGVQAAGRRLPMPDFK